MPDFMGYTLEQLGLGTLWSIATVRHILYTTESAIQICKIYCWSIVRIISLIELVAIFACVDWIKSLFLWI